MKQPSFIKILLVQCTHNDHRYFIFILLLSTDVTVGFERAGYNFNESVGTVVLNLVKTGSSETNISVTVTTIAGSALGKNVLRFNPVHPIGNSLSFSFWFVTDTDDYSGVSETLVIGAAETEVQLPITISNDDILEGVESFLAELSLTTPQQGVVIGLDTATLEIVDDDCTLYFANLLHSQQWIYESQNLSTSSRYKHSLQCILCSFYSYTALIRKL